MRQWRFGYCRNLVERLAGAREILQRYVARLFGLANALTSRAAITPDDLAGQPFIAMGGKAKVLRAVVDDYLARAGVVVTPAQSVDNPAMVMSLVASTGGLVLIPSYAENLMPWSVVSRPLAGEPPTIDLAVGYSKTNRSPILKLFLSRLDELVAQVAKREHRA